MRDPEKMAHAIKVSSDVRKEACELVLARYQWVIRMGATSFI